MSGEETGNRALKNPVNPLIDLISGSDNWQKGERSQRRTLSGFLFTTTSSRVFRLYDFNNTLTT